MRSDGKNLADRLRTPALEAALPVMIAGYADAPGRSSRSGTRC
jgi:hypothetical protein